MKIIQNLARTLCFAGHTDVVPPEFKSWKYDPFIGK